MIIEHQVYRTLCGQHTKATIKGQLKPTLEEVKVETDAC